MAAVTELSTISLSDFTSLTEQKFSVGMSMVKDYEDAKSLFIYMDIPKNTGKTKVFNEVDGETYASRKPEGADAQKSRVIMGYSKTMTKSRFAKEIDITYEMREENRHPEVVAALTDLSEFGWQRCALDLTHRITFATSTTYVDMDGETVDLTVGDGLALVSSVHTLTGSSTTYSNVITGNPQFSKGGYELAKDRTNSQIMNNFGDQRVMEFDTVVTGNDTATLDEVAILKRSTSDPTQNNSGVINSYQNSFRHVVLPRLATTATGARDSTKEKVWAYVATGGGMNKRWQAYFGMWEAPNLKTPAPGNNLEDAHNDNWTYGMRMGYGICIIVGKGFMYSTGLGV